MTGIEYEKLVAKYLCRHGYYGVSVTKASGDYGVDVIAHKGKHKYAVQCKYYSEPVSLSAIQEAVAGKTMYKCDRAMVVTNSTFTASAKELAAANNVVLLAEIGKRQIHTKHISLFTLLKQKIVDRNADKQINRVIKPGTPKKHFSVKGEIDKGQKYSQTGEHRGELQNSAITGLPHKFTVKGVSYDIDKLNDVQSFPLFFRLSALTEHNTFSMTTSGCVPSITVTKVTQSFQQHLKQRLLKLKLPLYSDCM